MRQSHKKVMLSRADFLKLSAGTVAALLLNACRSGAELTESPPPQLSPTVAHLESTATPDVTPTAKIREPVMPLPPEPVIIPNTETWIVPSAEGDRDFRIFVALPHSYHDTDKMYPVVYSLDANGGFGMVTDIVRMLHIGQEVPEVIIVGIGYPTNDDTEINNLRIKDFTPTTPQDGSMLDLGPTGSAGSFLRFIRETLKPFIQSQYRIIPENATLVGHSLGGLFALYTLFKYPDTFNRYIAGSPSIWWDNKVIFEYERYFAEDNTDLAAKVFMAMGSLESLTDINYMHNLAQNLKGREYANFELTTHVFEDETHMSIIPIFVNRGLRIVFGWENE